jgi:flagellar protein FlbD
MGTVLRLTRLSGSVLALNPDLMERAEATPDTVVTLVNGSKYVVLESLDTLADLVRAYRADVVASANPRDDPRPAVHEARTTLRRIGPKRRACVDE